MADLIEFIGLSYFVISCAQSSCISTFNPPFIYQNIEYHHFYACRNEIDEIQPKNYWDMDAEQSCVSHPWERCYLANLLIPNSNSSSKRIFVTVTYLSLVKLYIAWII